MVDRIFTIEDGRLGGRPGPYAAPWDLAAIKAAGFRAIVSLECARLDDGEIAAAGLEHWKLCVEDFTAPTLEQMEAFNEFVDRKFAEGKKVLVHCYAGRGRTVAMLASRLIWKGQAVEDALALLRRIARPALVPEQVEALHRFRRRVRAKGR